MNINKLKQKAQYAAAVAVTTALPAMAMADDLPDGAVEALGGLKTGIVAVGVVAVTLAVAAVSISVIKSAIKRSA